MHGYSLLLTEQKLGALKYSVHFESKQFMKCSKEVLVQELMEDPKLDFNGELSQQHEVLMSV